MFERDEEKLARRIAKTLAELIGREHTLKPIPAAQRVWPPAVSGLFTAAGVRTAMRVEADLPCAAFLGAALALVPAGRAKEIIEAGSLEAGLAENAREVFNVMTRALTLDASIRARLDQFVVVPPGSPPSKQTLAWDLSVDGYGSGRLGLTITFKPPG